jgi:hypothetical protein
LGLLIIEDVVEIGVFGYVCGEFGDTFATIRHTMAQSSSKLLNHKTFNVGLVLYITTVRVSYYSTESDGN